MNNYYSIKSPYDIDTFIDKTNALHDGYIIAVEYQNKGIKTTDMAHEFNSALTQLKVCVLITSMQDIVLEMIFENILEWKITEIHSEISEVALRFDDKGLLIWTDDAEGIDNIKENDSYIIARKMKWRILL